MAIEFEQERNSMSITGLLSGAVVVIALFAGVYLLLFKKPELIEVVFPGNLKSVQDISKISLDPEKALRSEKFRALRQYGESAPLPPAGKSNPFLP